MVCESPWLLVGIAAGVLGLFAVPILFLAWRARKESPRPALALAAALATLGALGVWSAMRGSPRMQLAALVFLPATLGCAYGAAWPEKRNVRIALAAAGATFALVALAVAGVALGAASGADCVPDGNRV